MNKEDLKQLTEIKKYHKEHIKIGINHKNNNDYDKFEYNNNSDIYPYNPYLYKNFTAENLIKSLNFNITRKSFNYHNTKLQTAILNFVKNYTKIITKLKKQNKLY